MRENSKTCASLVVILIYREPKTADRDFVLEGLRFPGISSNKVWSCPALTMHARRGSADTDYFIFINDWGFLPFESIAFASPPLVIRSLTMSVRPCS